MQQSQVHDEPLTDAGHPLRTERLRHQRPEPTAETTPAPPPSIGFQGRLDAWAAALPKAAVMDMRGRNAIDQAKAADRAAWQTLGVQKIIETAEQTAVKAFGVAPVVQRSVRFDATDYCSSAQLSAGAVPRVTPAGVEWQPLVELSVCHFLRSAPCREAGQLVIAWDGGCLSKPIAEWSRAEIEDLVLDRLRVAAQDLVLPRQEFPLARRGFIDEGNPGSW